MSNGNISNNTNSSNDDWSPEYLKTNIFNDLMDDKKGDKYINRFIDVFKFLRMKSPEAYFEIDKKDLSTETKNQLKIHIKDCKIKDEADLKLNGVFVKVITRIAKQAEPSILESIKYEDLVLVRGTKWDKRTCFF